MHRRAFLAALLAAAGCSRSSKRVVVYCAQDREFAEGLFASFKDETGLAAVPRFDTEANKSVGLFRDIVAEKGQARCDVFWNNEILSTLRLRKEGLLAAHASPSAEEYPAECRAPDHTWHAFAARARVFIVNTALIAEDDCPRGLAGLGSAKIAGRFVMARPQFGTTATQTACLFDVLGEEAAKAMMLGWKANGLQLAPGNKQVAEWVARGKTPLGKPAALGLTDTDDALAEVRAGKPVAVLLPDHQAEGRMGTLFIPNTLSIPEGCPNPEGARKLVDFLLSAESEKALAEGPGKQVPLNPKVKAKLPAPLDDLEDVKTMEVNWDKAADLWDAAQEFVTREFALA
ncbi:MAG: extracellular solute-binding protein [Gemmataceae bacterium]|nr:extracellular solute-binding protein [Gemmataceae bacterium]